MQIAKAIVAVVLSLALLGGCTMVELNIAPIHKTIVDVGDGTTDSYTASTNKVKGGDKLKGVVKFK